MAHVGWTVVFFEECGHPSDRARRRCRSSLDMTLSDNFRGRSRLGTREGRTSPVISWDHLTQAAARHADGRARTMREEYRLTVPRRADQGESNAKICTRPG